MPRNSAQKQKLLRLAEILLKKTDENHGLTASQLISELSAFGISTERKSLYDDLRVLESCGLDVCSTKSKTVRYYVGGRLFELPELKLLVDAIQSSKFVTEKKSAALIGKLESLVSVHEGKELQRQVVIANRAKTLNERIYYAVDKIHTAINGDRRISFKYYRWELDFSGTERIVRRERVKEGGYKVSPIVLCWDDENYYLVAYDGSSGEIRHYRVDKMDSIEITEEKREDENLYKTFDPAGYAKSVFSMFGGTKRDVKMSVDNELIGVMVDRFGKNIFVSKESEKTFCVTVNVVTSEQFYAWVFGLGGKVRIVAPKEAADEFKAQLKKVTDACSDDVFRLPRV